MPKITNHGKVEVRPDYIEAEDLAATIAEYRAYFDQKLASIDALGDSTTQLISMFAWIDCLAQENANYPNESPQKAFRQFVLKHQKQCDYMECVEPVTLYYHMEDLIDEVVPIPGFPPERAVSLDDIFLRTAKSIESVIHGNKAQEILDYIGQKYGTAFAEKKAKEHQLISLLYRMRSKAVHEMSGLGSCISVEQRDNPQQPFYRDIGRSYVHDGDWVSDDVIELVIPNIFVRNILADCIDGYLADCATNGHFPFSNNQMNRKHNLSWYDR
jgi:hypothetical protein